MQDFISGKKLQIQESLAIFGLTNFRAEERGKGHGEAVKSFEISWKKS